MHSIVQDQPFLSIRKRFFKGYLKGNAGEGKYVTFGRPLELLAGVKEFRSHPFWGAHPASRIGHRHVNKVRKSEISNFCFPGAANKYVLLDSHIDKARGNVGGSCSPLSNPHGTSLASVGVERPLQFEATSTRV
jgi:hypothetical protein